MNDATAVGDDLQKAKQAIETIVLGTQREWTEERGEDASRDPVGKLAVYVRVGPGSSRWAFASDLYCRAPALKYKDRFDAEVSRVAALPVQWEFEISWERIEKRLINY